MHRSSAAPGLIPYILLGVAGFSWGITFSLAKIAAEAGAHPIGLTFWQAVVGFVILGTFSLVRRRWPVMNRRSLIRSGLVALTGTVVPTTLYFYAAIHLSAGIMSITVAMVPIMTYAASLIIGSDAYQPKRLVGLTLGFTGMVLLVHPDALPDRTVLPWLLVAMLCALCYTLENLYVDNRVPPDVDMAGLLTLSMMIALLILGSVMLPLNAFTPLSYPFTALEYAVLGMGLITSFAYLIPVQAQGQLSHVV